MAPFDLPFLLTRRHMGTTEPEAADVMVDRVAKLMDEGGVVEGESLLPFGVDGRNDEGSHELKYGVVS